jgi:hypothetical protein
MGATLLIQQVLFSGTEIVDHPQPTPADRGSRLGDSRCANVVAGMWDNGQAAISPNVLSGGVRRWVSGDDFT